MKRIFLPLSLVLLASCSNVDEPAVQDSLNNPTATVGNSRIHSIEEAIEIARNAAEMIDGEGSRAIGRNVSNSLNAKVIYGGKASRGSVQDTALYVVDYDNEQGFAVISARRIEQPVLAVIDQGHYDEDEAVKIDGFSQFMENAATYSLTVPGDSMPYMGGNGLHIDPIIPGGGDGRFPMTQYIREVSENKDSQDPKVTVLWGQENYEGMYFKNNYCGCGTTAIAQALSYFEMPTSLNLTFAERSQDVLNLDWSLLKNHNNTYKYGYGVCFDCNDSVHIAFASLCRQIGVLASADDSDTKGTTTYRSGELSALRDLLPNKHVEYSTDYDYFDVADMIKKGIVLLRGDKENVDEPGHTWISDGYKWVIAHIREYSVDPNTGARTLIHSGTSRSQLLHCNWGWYGKCNGYFNWDCLNPARAASYDDPGMKFSSPNYKYIISAYISVY